LKAAIKEAKKTYNETKKPLNEALKVAKKNAHIKTLEYKASLIKIRDEKLADIAKRRVGVTSSDAIKKLDDEAFKAKDEYINATRLTRKQAKLDALKVMEEVGIPYPEKRYKQYPFEFSGGMRQRIVIAIALTANPDILICDEPTTALDVTIQAQILALINKLKESRHMSVIFITHDLGVVANMADRVAVMYAGKIVEYGKVNEIFYDPRHPYTWALLSSIPDIDSKERLDAIPGTPPNMLFPPKGDAFAFRSKYAMKVDFEKQPPYFEISPTHYAATWLLYPGAPKVEMPRIVRTRIENSLKKEGITREQALKQ
jgi:oligopeptide transport system ATP-binding protein